MSGDVQPRKRKDKKRKKDEPGLEEHRGTAAAFGEGDVQMHSQHDHGTGGHWCAKIIFFSLLAVLVTLIGLIILENRGLTELEANSVESQYSGILDGWIEDSPDDDHHDEHTLELKHHEQNDDIDEQEPENDQDIEDEDEQENGHDEHDEEFDHDEDDDGDEDDDDDIEHREDDTNEEDLGENASREKDNDDESQEDDNDDDEEDVGIEEINVDTAKNRYAKHDYEDDDDDDLDDDEDIDNNYNKNQSEEDGDFQENNEIREDIGDDDDLDDVSNEVATNGKPRDDTKSEQEVDEDNSMEEQDDEDDEEHEEDHEEEAEEEIEKIEKEVLDQDEPESTELPLPNISDEKEEDTSLEVVNPDEDYEIDDKEYLEVDELDEPAVERIAPPPPGKPYAEIEDEVSTETTPDTLAEEEEYEKQQEELRQQEAQSTHMWLKLAVGGALLAATHAVIRRATAPREDGGNSLEDDWPGEPSDPFWREQLEKAEQELRQGALVACEERAGAARLAGSGRARWLRASALDRLAERRRDNAVLARAIAAYKHLLEMNERLPDKKLLEVALRTIDRIQFRGTYLNAEPVYRLLIRRFPNDVTYRNNLTISFLMANRADLASEVLKETLRLWPNDRVALAHYGFVLKTEQNKLEEAVAYFQKALEGDAGPANEPRFYYHLGDALLLLGRTEEAHEVHKRGAALGHFLSSSQRSLYNVPRLKSRPWWDVETTPYAKLARELESAWREILKEGEAAQSLYEKEKEGLRERGDWSQLDLFLRGREVPGRCARAPVTCRIVRAEPAAQCRRGQVKFSLLSGGTHVRAHVGPTNCRLRMHLALTNTDRTYIRVDQEIRQWQVGKVLMFDDSYEHEVWHNGTRPRLVLIVDVWHPELTPHERRALPPI